MAWGGKMALGALGAVIGGPIGAIIGAAIGHVIDAKPSQFNGSYSSNEQKQIAYLTCFFTSLAKIAKADGAITKEEINAVERIMAQLKFNDEIKEFAISVFREAKDSDEPVESYLNQFGEIVSFDSSACTMLAYSLFTVAAADGHIHTEENKILLTCEEILRLPLGTIRSFSQTSGGSMNTSLDEYYSLLGCSKSSSADEIKSAYRKKCIEYHPDKIQSKGLPEEFVKFANDHLSKLNEAYDKIKKAKGFQ